MAFTPAFEGAEGSGEVLAAFGQLVLHPGRHGVDDRPREDPERLKLLEPVAERPRVATADHDRELVEAAFAASQLVDDERDPLLAEQLQRRPDWAVFVVSRSRGGSLHQATTVSQAPKRVQ